MKIFKEGGHRLFESDPQTVAAVGEKAELIAEGCMESGGTALHFDSRESALRTLTAQFTPHTAMLVKASHAMRFGEIVEELRKTYD